MLFCRGGAEENAMNTILKLTLVLIVFILAATTDGLVVYGVKMFSGPKQTAETEIGGEPLPKTPQPGQNETVKSQEIQPTTAPSPEKPPPAGQPSPDGPAAVQSPSQGPSADASQSPSPALRKDSPANVIGNRDSKRYHLPGMIYFDKVDAHHRVEFPSEEEAIKAGYRKAPQ
jgi:hypothetical protein